MDKRKLILPGLLTILLAIGEVLKTDPALIEKLYSRGLYLPIIRSLNGISGWVPFSVFEALLCFLMLSLAVALGILGWRLRSSRRTRVLWIDTGLRILTLILGFMVFFNVAWGFNYYRLALSEQLGIQVRKHSQIELTDLCKRLVLEANALSTTVDRSADGAMKPSTAVEDVFARTAQGFLNIHGRIPLFDVRYGSPKPVWNSVLMSYAGIAGIYTPFTGEANVNALLPAAMLPATATHEMAHVYGYAREDEANFIAWLACRVHPDADFKYSGALLGLIYGMNALASSDIDEYRRLKADYSAGVAADLATNRKFWKQYEGPAEELQEQVNDQYLKANGQADGVESYGRMVDLLLEVNSGTLKIDD